MGSHKGRILIKVKGTTKKQKKINKARAACKTQNFYILLALFLINIALLIAVSIYCYLINYQE